MVPALAELGGRLKQDFRGIGNELPRLPIRLALTGPVVVLPVAKLVVILANVEAVPGLTVGAFVRLPLAVVFIPPTPNVGQSARVLRGRPLTAIRVKIGLRVALRLSS
jgi:hypothetical protein